VKTKDRLKIHVNKPKRDYWYPVLFLIIVTLMILIGFDVI